MAKIQVAAPLILLTLVLAIHVPAALASRTLQQSSTTTAGPKNLIVLILENRSFDNIFGFLKRERPEVDGLTGTEFNIGNGTAYTVSPYSGYAPPDDPPHDMNRILLEIFNETTSYSYTPSKAGKGNMAGHVRAMADLYQTSDPLILQEVMDCFNPMTLPVFYQLANEFLLFDRWFAAVPGPTWPNRHFAVAGTAAGHTSNTYAAGEQASGGFTFRTIFENLDEASVSWKVYGSRISAVPTNSDVQRFKYMNDTKQTRPQNWGDFNAFVADAQAGNLPRFSYLQPVGETDMHPPANVQVGEGYIASLYHALRNGPQWNDSLLLITFDENGGYYDHVPPPAAPRPDNILPADIGFTPNFDFSMLGPRVPSLLISPWVQKRALVNKPQNGPQPDSEYEHSSIPATVKQFFNLPQGYLTKRDAWAAPFHTLANLQQPRTDCPVELNQFGPMTGLHNYRA